MNFKNLSRYRFYSKKFKARCEKAQTERQNGKPVIIFSATRELGEIKPRIRFTPEEYKQFMKSELWVETKKLYKQYRCFICNSTEDLALHHIDYYELDNPKYLVTLCNRCHHTVHFNGKHRILIENIANRFLAVKKRFDKKHPNRTGYYQKKKTGYYKLGYEVKN